VAVVDFTPNYMCDADAMRRIHQSAALPSKLRFIVLMRDPVMRAFSEYAMFTYGWCAGHVERAPSVRRACATVMMALRPPCRRPMRCPGFGTHVATFRVWQTNPLRRCVLTLHAHQTLW
jgi:hypothetical protein